MHVYGDGATVYRERIVCGGGSGRSGPTFIFGFFHHTTIAEEQREGEQHVENQRANNLLRASSHAKNYSAVHLNATEAQE
jgi:hypothetical protein